MEEKELINFVGNMLVGNWKLISGVFFTVFGSCIAGSWWLSNILHKKEIRILQLELSNQKERFTQFESIVEQRITFLNQEAELLQEKKLANHTDSEFNKSTNQRVDGKADLDNYLDMPAFMRKSAGVEDSSTMTTEFLDKTDAISKIFAYMA